MPAYFTHHARSRPLQRYGEQFTEEEEASIPKVVLGEMHEEEGVAHLDIKLATRPDEYRLVVKMPQGAIMTIIRTRQTDAKTLRKINHERRSKAEQWKQQCAHDAKGINRRMRMSRSRLKSLTCLRLAYASQLRIGHGLF